MPHPNSTLLLNSKGTQVQSVQTNLTKIGLTIPSSETSATLLGTGTSAALLQFQEQYKLNPTGLADAATQAMLNNAAAATAANQSTVAGQMVMDYGAPANGVTARLYSIGYAGAATKLAETKTNANGVYSLAYAPPSSPINVEVRVLDPSGNEVTVSSVIYSVPAQEALNLVLPATVQPLAAEFDRLSSDLKTAIGGVQNLSKAEQNGAQQDLTLLNQTTGWDPRLLALASTAAQNTAATGMGQDALYALYRAGLPSNPKQLAMLPATTIGLALNKAVQSGVVNLTAQQISSAQSAFTTFATKTKLGMNVPGAPSTFQDLLNNALPAGTVAAAQQTAFASVFFDPTTPPDQLWQKAASAGLSAAQISTLQLQGKLAALTFNNAPLTANLQTQITSTANLSQLAAKDFHLPATWKATLNTVSGNNATTLAALIPQQYNGSADAYAADMARKVRVSFPTHVVARMVESNAIAVPTGASATPVVTFLRTAADAGYELGKTPLNRFLKKLPTGVAAPDAPTTGAIKKLHRLFQITPSNESLQAAVGAGFNSARDIAAFTFDDFMARFGAKFPSADEASMVYRKAQQVAAVTLNVATAAKHLQSTPNLPVLSAPDAVQEAAQASLIEQFPSIQNLFGSLDYMQCDDCRSVLSPAAYFVDVLHFLDPDDVPWNSFLANWQNSHGQAYPYPKPFDVLNQRRPDLANLNLSCPNTNTELPYIDVVNEIFEYYVANGNLTNENHDTGAANSADLVAEPQNLLPQAYAILGNQVAANPTVFPSGLPFDLWIETVRGCLAYLKIPLSRILEVFRPADQLELFTDSSNYPYYQASIFAESLGISPAEYAIYTDADTANNWFKLYGYADATTAKASLKSAATLAQRLGVSYQDLATLATSSFLNPGLAAIYLPLNRLGISLDQAFSYTEQAGFTAMDAPTTATFETYLGTLSAKYPGLAFDAKAWLKSTLTTGYSKTVLLLNDAGSEADFSAVNFQYADGSPAADVDWVKLNLFVRLWKKLGWTIDEVDRALAAFIPASSLPLTTANIGAAFKSALVLLAHLQELSDELKPALGRAALLPLWANISTTGNNPLYAQLFLTSSVLTDAPQFDNPTGTFPSPVPAPPSAAAASFLAGLRGVLGLSANDFQAILADASASLPANSPAPTGFSLADMSLLYRYALLAHCLNLPIDDLLSLKAMSGLNPFAAPGTQPLQMLKDDTLFNQTLPFVQQVKATQATMFKVADLNYLFRHQFDPAGPYNLDPPQLMQQIRSMATAINAILNGNTSSQSLIQQSIVHALSSAFNADVPLTTGLVTDPSLLADPMQPGISLITTFQAVAKYGVTATYFSDATANTAVGSNTLGTTDTSTDKNKPAAYLSIRLEGYVEAAADGAYQISAVATASGAQVTIQFDGMTSVSGAATSAAPLKATVPLKAGIPCHFVITLTGAGDIQVGLQTGGNITSLANQFVLYPQASVTQFTRAYLLLQKVLILINGFGLDLTEVQYFASHAGDFGNFNLGLMPLTPVEATAATAQNLFEQFLRLANYAKLRTGPAGGTDGLINIFQASRQNFASGTNPGSAASQSLASVCQAIANLTRRQAPSIQSALQQLPGYTNTQSATFGTPAQLQITLSSLTNDLGFARLWEALQLTQTLGIDAATASSITGIVSASRMTASPDPGLAIAATLKNAIKAQYPNSWRTIAKSIFDPLRQKKRDALCNYLINKLGLQNTNQLFEYFLVDPGMEPVVQTSRLRLAMSSVQTFVQRCLLNLEPQVHPSVIDSSQWEWMKRYRVWQANREIFLWPENWLIPEFRQNSSDLFQTLQGNLLQGDITEDLVESAFAKYLQDLETRARLQIVSIYNQPPANPADSNIYHVIGRTFNKPAKYFYRTYSNGMWQPWIPVTIDIEGDHIVAIVWRGRLTLFWVTFMMQSQAQQSPQPNGASVTSLDLGTLLSEVPQPQTYLQAQLHWSEFYQGKWSPPKAGSFQSPPGGWLVRANFDPIAGVYISCSLGDATDPNAVIINLQPPPGANGQSAAGCYAFRLSGKNSEPSFQAGSPLTGYPFPVPTGISATKYCGTGAMQIVLPQDTNEVNGQTVLNSSKTETLLSGGGQYAVLPCSSLAGASIESALPSPFFYEDRSDPKNPVESTFFVQPQYEQTTFVKWIWWAISPTFLDTPITDGSYLNTIIIKPQIPAIYQPVKISPVAKFPVMGNVDWVTNPATAVSFGTQVISKPFDGAASGVLRANNLLGNGTNHQLTFSTDGQYHLVGTGGLTAATFRTFNPVESN